MSNLRKSIISLCVIVLSIGIFNGCGEKGLKEENVSFSFNKLKNEKTGLDNNFDLIIDYDDNISDVTFTLYEKRLDKDGEKEQEMITKETKGSDSEIRYSILNKPKGKYEYKIISKDNNDNTAENTVEIIISDDGTENENVQEEEKESDKEKLEDKSYDEWSKDGIEYKSGDKVIFDNNKYECLQDHKSQEDWTPSAAPSLWKSL